VATRASKFAPLLCRFVSDKCNGTIRKQQVVTSFGCNLDHCLYALVPHANGNNQSCEPGEQVDNTLIIQAENGLTSVEILQVVVSFSCEKL
jgi:hypothetical protein